MITPNNPPIYDNTSVTFIKFLFIINDLEDFLRFNLKYYERPSAKLLHSEFSYTIPVWIYWSPKGNKFLSVCKL